MQEFALFALVGFVAQLIDGALGMAYGVISATMLLSFGVLPAHVSAAVHSAKLFTTAAAGWSHHHHRNVDWPLLLRLAPFGIAGGCAGVFVLTSVDAQSVRPLVTAYLALVGIWILLRSFQKIRFRPVPGMLVAPLGAIGGFLDAAGGGGWGPIVTTGLLGAGAPPRYVIGTVNTAEFIVTLSVAAAFIVAMLSGHWRNAGGFSAVGPAVLGLIAGGLCAAPLAGRLVRNIPETRLLRIVGCLIVGLAGFQTLQALR